MVVGDALRSGLGKHPKGDSATVAAQTIARFTQYVVEAKAKELLCRCINAQLEAGAQVEQMDSMFDCITNFLVVGTET